jgi:hypothetical protein
MISKYKTYIRKKIANSDVHTSTPLSVTSILRNQNMTVMLSGVEACYSN